MELANIANIAIIVALIAVVLTLLKPFLNQSQSVALLNKFKKLGNMTGKSIDEIKAVAGNPSTSEALTDGIAFTWDSPKYAIKLKFDKNNICVGKLGEVSKK